MQRLLLDWDQAAAAGPAVAGGKGWNLGRLWRYGLPVPDGMVLAAQAYRLTLEHAGLAAAAAAFERTAGHAATNRAESRRIETSHVEPGHAGAGGTDTEEAEAAALERLRAQIEAAALPAAVRDALAAALARPGLRGAPLAVRSSATAEDGANASFAGMHHTSLNVPPRLEDVAAAVQRGYASLWTPHALAYRRRHGVRGVEMAIAIVRLVPAQAAGVAFTADPQRGRYDMAVVAANYGLGESVVAGTAEPDEYHVVYGHGAPPTIATRRLGRKERRTEPAPGGGTHTVDHAPHHNHHDRPGSPHAGSAVLDDARVLDVATLALRCQDAIGEDYEPQDVEWAFDGERMWILQSRPITALAGALPAALRSQPVIWSTANLKEVLPAVHTPYGWSTIRLSLPAMLERLLAQSGYDVPPGMRWVRLYQGRSYFNLSLLQWVFFDAFGVAPAQTNRMLGGRQPEIALPPPPPLASRARLRRLWRLVRQVAGTRSAFKTIRRASAAMDRTTEQYLRRDLAAQSDAQLLTDLRTMAAATAPFTTEFMRANSQASTWLDALFRLMGRLLPEGGQALAMRLLAGTGGIASAEQGYRLIEIARLAATEPRARAFFLDADTARPGEPAEQGAAPQATDWERALAGTKTGEAFAAFLRDFGHRAVDEVDISVPRWAEDPSYLVETVRQHLLSEVEAPPDPRIARAAAEAELRRRLRFHPARPIVWWVVRQARAASALRENTKSAVVRTLFMFRRYVLEVGRRYAVRGVLPSPESIFWLTVPDLEALDRGLWDGRGAERLIADRRERYQAQLALRPPDVLLDDTPATPPRPSPAGASRETGGHGERAAGTVLDGLGVSAGHAAGAARVVMHPREGHRLKKGEVLVAPSTDPGWTPLFLRAAALVLETGGYLSHGAIVAREYGIPAVANVTGATDVVRDGDELVVDGDGGKVVWRQGQGDEPAEPAW